MKKRRTSRTRHRLRRQLTRTQSRGSIVPTLGFALALISACIAVAFGIVRVWEPFAVHYAANMTTGTSTTTQPSPPEPSLDREVYRREMYALADRTVGTSTGGTADSATTTQTGTATSTADASRWPVTPFTYPKPGAILPFQRVVAYYGNFYSEHMGILGQYEPDRVIERLREQVAAWERADPETPVVPAIHYIAVTAQHKPGDDGQYRLRMPHDQIDRALEMAERVDGIVFLDVQVGLSSLQDELPLLKEYLRKPNVHLAIDPEFAMHDGQPPGSAIGSYDAADINYASQFLGRLVRKHDVPPKMLVIHRFTQDMVTNYDEIERRREVQLVMHMDGWGPPSLKRGTYRRVIEPEPVQFTGFKVFYENDRRPPSPGIMQPAEIRTLHPEPIYIQYQ